MTIKRKILVIAVLMISIISLQVQANTCINPFACSTQIIIHFVDQNNLMKGQTIKWQIIDENYKSTSGSVKVGFSFGQSSMPPSPHYKVKVTDSSGASLTKLLDRDRYNVYKDENNHFKFSKR